MDGNDYYLYWLESSDQDYKTMLNLYESKDYNWSLFVGHLVIEKLLKALFFKSNIQPIPKSHDLLRLADILKIDMNEIQKEQLDMITTFNINTRYPDYKKAFFIKCDNEFTKANISIIKELRQWLKIALINQ